MKNSISNNIHGLTYEEGERLAKALKDKGFERFLTVEKLKGMHEPFYVITFSFGDIETSFFSAQEPQPKKGE